MAVAQTIQELTGSKYNELYYNSASTDIKGSFVRTICDTLDKCGITINSTTTYDDSVETAVRAFQKQAGLSITGVLNNNTWQTMLLYAAKLSDSIDDDSSSSSAGSLDVSDSPHFNSFFNDDNFKQARKNHQDIKIVFGNKTITKTIKDVFMRSVTVEVDTSGNPISEIYEFVARDITESDELQDLKKYNSPESFASSDVQYQYNFGASK